MTASTALSSQGDQNRTAKSRRRECGLVGVALVLLLVLARPAAAHPSDFDTLTLDLLIDPNGLAAIDAAVVQSSGSSYEPFPATTLKRDVAVEVLRALHSTSSNAEIDARHSPRYHEVGFQISFDDSPLGQTARLAVETRPLQELAHSHGMEQFKMSVCGVTDEGERPDREVLAALDIRADDPGQAPTGQERSACRIWSLHHQDPAISVVVAPQNLAETGLATSHAGWLAIVLVLLGWAMRDIAGRSGS